MAKWAPSEYCLNCGEAPDHEHKPSCPRFPKFPGGRMPTREAPCIVTLSHDDGYDGLRHVLALALEQASVGKGKERHANGKAFDRQPIMEIGRMVGSGYPLGQAMKKAQESTRLPPDRAKAELLGAINYLAAAYLLLEGNAEK